MLSGILGSGLAKARSLPGVSPYWTTLTREKTDIPVCGHSDMDSGFLFIVALGTKAPVGSQGAEVCGGFDSDL